MIKTNQRILVLILVLFFAMITTYAYDSPNSVPSLILEKSETEFWDIAKGCSWNNNHVAISDTSVTSINYISEIGVYSKDNKFLFYIPKAAFTRAFIQGYLQLAIYDRTSKKVSMLEKIGIKGVVEEPLPPIIIMNMSISEFRTEVVKYNWNEYLLPRNEKQVNPVNIYHYTSVYTSDRQYLFDVARDQAEYILKSGFIQLAKMPNSTTIEIVTKIPLLK